MIAKRTLAFLLLTALLALTASACCFDPFYHRGGRGGRGGHGGHGGHRYSSLSLQQAALSSPA